MLNPCIKVWREREVESSEIILSLEMPFGTDKAAKRRPFAGTLLIQVQVDHHGTLVDWATIIDGRDFEYFDAIQSRTFSHMSNEECYEMFNNPEYLIDIIAMELGRSARNLRGLDGHAMLYPRIGGDSVLIFWDSRDQNYSLSPLRVTDTDELELALDELGFRDVSFDESLESCNRAIYLVQVLHALNHADPVS